MSTVVQVASIDELQRQVRSAGPRGILARGLGRSYGDAAQSGGARVLDLGPFCEIELDEDAATVTAGSGVSLGYLLRVVVPRGFFVPVTPGTRMVTMGGAVASDVHGKNNHLEGTFGSHVRSLDVVDGHGDLRHLTPDEDPEEFWATVAGMGLTGIITEVSFDALPITSSYMAVDTDRFEDLDSLMARMSESDSDHRYSVAWLDSLSRSDRGILMQGDHAPAEVLPAKLAADPLAYDPKAIATAPTRFPGSLLNTLSMRAFNEAWFRKAPKHRRDELQRLAGYFHPLDIVREWSRIYGARGFVQYQYAVPDSGAHVVRRSLERLRAAHVPTFLTLLKRFGPANPAPLSFPRPGWTLALDMPADVPGLSDVLDELDGMVLEADGRFYLAKDSRMSPETMAASYPRLDEWRAVRKRMDPDGVFASDLSRRLGL
ncbi:MAG: FAD-binding protein [Candidatus Nanopelagicales bacterium]